jgi:uncharacterized protein GlcG (DUF336 family)
MRSSVFYAGIFTAAILTSQACAQSNLDKFTVTGEMAKKAMVRGEIRVDVAEKLNQVCVEFAKARKLEVANMILAPSGEIVLAYRMDGNAQSPFIMETAMLRARTALARQQSTRALYNAAEGNGDISREIRYFATPDPYAVPGGVPIVVDDQIIGVMATSGMGDPDEDCVYAALEKGLDRSRNECRNCRVRRRSGRALLRVANRSRGALRSGKP